MSLKLDYSKRDLDETLTEIQALVPTLTDKWTVFRDDDIGTAIVKLFAGISDKLHFYLDRQAAENYLSSCELRYSAVSRAKELGYKVGRRTSSQGVIRFSLISAYSENIIILANTTVSIEGINFTTINNTVLTAGNLFVDVTVIQGSSYSISIGSSGERWQKYGVPSNVVNITVSINNEAWTEVDSFVMNSTQKAYKVYEDLKGLVVEFGAGITSIVPAAGSTVSIKGILSAGSLGNPEDAKSAVTLVSTIRNSSNSPINNILSLSISSIPVGGADAESIDSIKNNAPKFFATQNRAVTTTDYEVLARNYVSGLQGVTAIGGETIGRYGEVHVTCYANDPNNVPQLLLDTVQSTLSKYNVDGISIVVSAPVVITVDLYIDIYGKKFTNLSDSRNKTISLVTSYINSLGIGNFFQNSDLIVSIIDNIPDVDHINIKDSLTMVKVPALIGSNVVNCEVINNVDPTSIKIYKSNVLIWSYGDSLSTLSNNQFSTTVPGTITDGSVTLSMLSTLKDIYPTDRQLLNVGTLTINADFTKS